MYKYLTFLGALFLSPFLMAQEPNAYISDSIYTTLRAGPSVQYDVLGSVEAGQKITALGENKDNYTKIIDNLGREGWVLKKHVSEEMSVRYRYPEVVKQLEEANAKLETIHADTKEKIDDLESKNSQYQTELTVLKAKLKETSTNLEVAIAERETAVTTLKHEQDNKRFKMWQEGGLIAFIGLFLGVVLVYLPKPNRRSKGRWM